MIEVGTKCKHKNIVCDGLCNNCWDREKVKLNSYDFATRKPYGYELPDYEELILASQEIDI